MMTPAKPTQEEKERLGTELTAWKKNTLAQDQLLLAQQKVKKVEAADELKSAKDMADAPDAPDAPAEAPDAPAETPAPAAAPTADKLKVKTKGPNGTEKIKQKGDAPR